jgi:tRNA pseudouridine13 synthase
LVKPAALTADPRGKREESQVLVLNEQNISEYSIEDVVLPLPGHSVVYPNNQSKNIFVLWFMSPLKDKFVVSSERVL